MTSNSNFTIRVYGLLIQDNHLLVVDEVIRDKSITKFPGGGLEFGEGTRDCLIREMQEETGLEIEVDEHFYTTDFFQQSAFHQRPLQVISIYYTISFVRKLGFQQIVEPVSIGPIVGFRWIALKDLQPEQLSLPIDRFVVKMLLEKYKF